MPPDSKEESPPQTTLSEFFETKPSHIIFTIREKIDARSFNSYPDSCDIKLPSIRLWCNSSECGSLQVFQPKTPKVKIQKDKVRDSIVEFVCCSCHEFAKKYAFWLRYISKSNQLEAVKLGEHPPLSPRLPSRLRTLVGQDQEKLNKGLRSEDHGLGVGAFAYYRQIVEDQKDRLTDEITKVASIHNPNQKLLKELEEAKRQNQFSTAVERIKQAIPTELLINGSNPLTLLHKALSEGLHAGTDEECLEIAQDIRVVLSEFSERLHAALKDDQELKKAVSRIENRSKKRPGVSEIGSGK